MRAPASARSRCGSAPRRPASSTCSLVTARVSSCALLRRGSPARASCWRSARCRWPSSKSARSPRRTGARAQREPRRNRPPASGVRRAAGDRTGMKRRSRGVRGVLAWRFARRSRPRAASVTHRHGLPTAPSRRARARRSRRGEPRELGGRRIRSKRRSGRFASWRAASIAATTSRLPRALRSTRRFSISTPAQAGVAACRHLGGSPRPVPLARIARRSRTRAWPRAASSRRRSARALAASS